MLMIFQAILILSMIMNNSSVIILLRIMVTVKEKIR